MPRGIKSCLNKGKTPRLALSPLQTLIPTTITDNPNPSLKITTSLFNGQNYLTWSQSLTMFLKSRVKMGYVNGRIQAPSTTDPGYGQWEITNSLILPPIPAKGISHKHLSYAALLRALFRGNKRFFSTSPSSLMARKRLDHLQDYKPVCTADSVRYRKFIAQERAFAYVQNEESRRYAMMFPVSIDHSALLSTSRDGLSLTPIPPSTAKESVFCDYL
ncbi:hypothetical protein HYC85_028871 [Camellia sinensis]|uniref:Retrotransposon Copia-like N-terminal domain-containing protein n=1 Tax=Camellia sinensis TaxID=4442 RepID=A0A7J7FWB2_CAMSI|nr:hypothetical protein HYC85_028871 [Camellia sinensis]